MKHISYYFRNIIFVFFICVSFSYAAGDNANTNINAVREKFTIEKLYNEGFYFSGRRARLIAHPDGERWFLVFSKVSQKALPEIEANSDGVADPEVIKQNPEISVLEVLPSRWLETMLRVVNNKSDYGIIFRIWGETTAYQNRNFIILSMVATESLFSEAAAEKQKETESSPFYSTQSENNNKQNPEDTGIVPQYVRDKLMKVPRVNVMSFPFKMKNIDEDSVTINDTQGTADVFENDTTITNRVGRLIPNQSEGRIYFMFESGDGNIDQKPLIIQPCQYLELMETAIRANNHSVKYKISGRIDEFKGEFYLLPTMVLEEEYRGM